MSRLYHNEGNGGRFRDVTVKMGLNAKGWGQGVCAADYDNDGYTDLFVTYWGQNHLYRNMQGARFEDVTERAGPPGRTAYVTTPAAPSWITIMTAMPTCSSRIT